MEIFFLVSAGRDRINRKFLKKLDKVKILLDFVKF